MCVPVYLHILLFLFLWKFCKENFDGLKNYKKLKKKTKKTERIEWTQGTEKHSMNASQSNALKNDSSLVFVCLLCTVWANPIKRMRLCPLCNFVPFWGANCFQLAFPHSLPVCILHSAAINSLWDFLVSGLQQRLIAFWPDVVFVILPHRAVRLFLGRECSGRQRCGGRAAKFVNA